MQCDKGKLLRWGAALMLTASIGVHMASFAFADSCDDDPQAIGSDSDYASGKVALERKDWKHAVRHFERAARRYPDNADIQSVLGLAHQKAGGLELAFKHYRQALKLDRRHRAAHQHLGEAYLMKADLAGAEEQLNALRQICLLGCDELAALEREINDYRAKSTASR